MLLHSRSSRTIATALVTALLSILIPVVPALAATQYAKVHTLASTLHEEPGGQPPTILVSGALPQDAPLPATIALPVPSNANIYWTGEVLGGDPANDPQLQYRVEKADGYDLIVMTLTKARLGQVEYAGEPIGVEGDSKTVKLALPVPYDVDIVDLSLRVPTSAKVTTSTPGMEAHQAAIDTTYYSLRKTSPAVGSKVDAAVTYTGGGAAGAPIAAPSQAAGSGDSSAILLAILGIGVVAGIVFVRAASSKLARQKRSAEEAEGEESARAAAPGAGSVAIADAPGEHAEGDNGRPADDEQPAEEYEVEAPRSAASARIRRTLILVPLFLAALGIGVVMMSQDSVGTTFENGSKVGKVLGKADPAATFTGRISLGKEDPAHEVAHVYEALAPIAGGLAKAEVDLSSFDVVITYDPQLVNEGQIAKALADGGYPATQQ